MVSNYHHLQRIFTIPKDECHTRQIKKEEQFSPIVTIVDTATRETLDYIYILLHGERPPEMSCKALFCYIEVQLYDGTLAPLPHPTNTIGGIEKKH